MKIFLSRFNITLTEEQKKLFEEGKPIQSWVQIFKPGIFKHPRYGTLRFTDEIFDGFVKSFKDNVRNIDLAIDQNHQPEKGAAAWIKDVENRGTSNQECGLWALVEWTKWGFQLVMDKVFKYLSGDFDYEWKDEETGKKYKNVLFGAALTNRPFIKGMSPINLSEFVKELNKTGDTEEILRLAEDILMLKEETGMKKTDEEILKAKDEDLTPEEKTRKAELLKMKKDEEEMMLAKKKALSERAKKVKLADTATEEEILAAEKKLQDEIRNENEQRVKRAKAVGLGPDATLEEIEREEKKAITKQREMEKNKGLSAEEMTKLLTELPSMEKKLAELKEINGDSFTVKLLEETITVRKKLEEEKLKGYKEKVSAMLKNHWAQGKLTAKERTMLETILCSDMELGGKSITLNEKDADGKDVQTVKTFSEVIDGILSDRPAIVELKELAQKELSQPPKDDSAKLEEEEAKKLGAEIAGKVTSATKTRTKQLAEGQK